MQKTAVINTPFTIEENKKNLFEELGFHGVLL